MRPVFDFGGGPAHDHKGFNWRVLHERLKQQFDVTRSWRARSRGSVRSPRRCGSSAESPAFAARRGKRMKPFASASSATFAKRDGTAWISIADMLLDTLALPCRRGDLRATRLRPPMIPRLTRLPVVGRSSRAHASATG